MTTTKKKSVKKKAVKSKSKEISVPSEPALPADATPTQAVMHGLLTSLGKGLEPEQLKLVLDAQERVLNRQAKEDYQRAMMRVQMGMPAIRKNKRNNHTDSEYADLDHIINIIRPIYTQEGFAISFGTEDSPLNHPGEDPYYVRVTCDVMHIAGWSKHEFVDVPLDMTGPGGKINKTKVHGTASAISYGRRYLTALIFNLATSDDDDGNAAGQAPELTEDQIADLWVLINDAKPNIDAFLKFAGASEVDRIPLRNYDKCVQMLQKKINQSTEEIVL